MPLIYSKFCLEILHPIDLPGIWPLALKKMCYSLRILTNYHDNHPEKIGVETQFMPRGHKSGLETTHTKKITAPPSGAFETIRSILLHCAT